MSHPHCFAGPCPAPEAASGGWFCLRGLGEPWEAEFQDGLHALRVLSDRAWGRHGGRDRPDDATPRIECSWDPPGGPLPDGMPRRWRLLTRAPGAVGGAHLARLQEELEEQGVDASRIGLTTWVEGGCRGRTGDGDGLEDLVEHCRAILRGR